MATDAPSIITPEVRRFLTGTPPRYATIATTNADGSPHQIVVWFLLRGDEFIVNSRRGRRWPSNLGRDRRASMCVYEGDDAITLDVALERMYEGDTAQADIAEMAGRFDLPDAAQEGIARFQTQERVSFVLRPTRVYIHGGAG